MGIETSYTATITKTCDGCGARYRGEARFSSVSALLAFGGPAEAAGWEIHMTKDGASLLCALCAKHKAETP